jgi:hypothetical protein
MSLWKRFLKVLRCKYTLDARQTICENKKSSMGKLVRLVSSDLVEFSVEKEIAMQSVLLSNMIEDCAEDDLPIPLPNASSSALEKVGLSLLTLFSLLSLLSALSALCSLLFYSLYTLLRTHINSPYKIIGHCLLRAL